MVTPSTEIYTLSLHDALPIWRGIRRWRALGSCRRGRGSGNLVGRDDLHLLRLDLARERQRIGRRSEEHTSELQSRVELVCRLLLEKKKITRKYIDSRLNLDKK